MPRVPPRGSRSGTGSSPASGSPALQPPAGKAAAVAPRGPWLRRFRAYGGSVTRSFHDIAGQVPRAAFGQTGPPLYPPKAPLQFSTDLPQYRRGMMCPHCARPRGQQRLPDSQRRTPHAQRLSPDIQRSAALRCSATGARTGRGTSNEQVMYRSGTGRPGTKNCFAPGSILGFLPVLVARSYGRPVPAAGRASGPLLRLPQPQWPAPPARHLSRAGRRDAA
jgi:hypothetical protein